MIWGLHASALIHRVPCLQGPGQLVAAGALVEAGHGSVQEALRLRHQLWQAGNELALGNGAAHDLTQQGKERPRAACKGQHLSHTALREHSSLRCSQAVHRSDQPRDWKGCALPAKGSTCQTPPCVNTSCQATVLVCLRAQRLTSTVRLLTAGRARATSYLQSWVHCQSHAHLSQLNI